MKKALITLALITMLISATSVFAYMRCWVDDDGNQVCSEIYNYGYWNGLDDWDNGLVVGTGFVDYGHYWHQWHNGNGRVYFNGGGMHGGMHGFHR